jgi:D-alanyl-D-alanine carboxypeptidase
MSPGPAAAAVDITPLSPTLFGAAGAIVSNASDVARFYRALLRGRLPTPQLLSEMQTIDPAATGGEPDHGILGGGWGLGLLREEFPCGEARGTMRNPGYMIAAWNSKDATRPVMVIVNSNFEHYAPVSEAMREVLITGTAANTVADQRRVEGELPSRKSSRDGGL